MEELPSRWAYVVEPSFIKEDATGDDTYLLEALTEELRRRWAHVVPSTTNESSVDTGVGSGSQDDPINRSHSSVSSRRWGRRVRERPRLRCYPDRDPAEALPDIPEEDIVPDNCNEDIKPITDAAVDTVADWPMENFSDIGSEEEESTDDYKDSGRI